MASVGTHPVLSLVAGFALGVPVVAWGIYGVAHDTTLEVAPRTKGLVVTASLDEARRVVGRGDQRTTASLWTPHVVYTYEVEGDRHRGERLAETPPPRFDDESEATAFLAHWPVGSTVTVFYDPTDPTDATLTPPTSGPGPWLILLGLALVGAGVGHWAVAR